MNRGSDLTRAPTYIDNASGSGFDDYLLQEFAVLSVGEQPITYGRPQVYKYNRSH